jgi:aromatic-L-amino-acid decarboxylase
MQPNPTQSNLGDIDSTVFQQAGHFLIDWIVEYINHPERYPVLSTSKPGEIAAQLPSDPPKEPEAIDRILQDFEKIILPGITHWNHPGFFAYFGITGSAPGVLAELLSAALNVNAMKWKTSPAATELEEVSLRWLQKMIGVPSDFEGVIMDTASMSSMIAIAGAREAIPGLHIRHQGLSGREDIPRLRLYISDQTHSSVEKGAIVLGIGQENVVKVESDQKFRMIPSALRMAVEQDIEMGYLPFFVCGTIGTTSTTSVDPIRKIGEICTEFDLWFHVDGAYGATAAILPELRHLMDGIDLADSFVVNPHKWLFTPIDLSAFYTRHLSTFKRAFSLVPDYLQTAEENVKDYMDYGVQLGRRFRALKLWMVMRAYGQNGLEARIREHIRLAKSFESKIRNSERFELMAPVPFSTVCFRAKPGYASDQESLNTLNQDLLEAINETGKVFLSHTVLQDQYALRLAIGNIRSDERYINLVWELVNQKLSELANA